MLVLAWKLDAQSMGYFTLQEWLRGMGSLQYVSYLLFIFVHADYCLAVFSLSLVISGVPLVLSRAGDEVWSLSKALFCCCQVRLHREAEELARLPEICP